MHQQIDLKRVLIFLAFAFGIAWLSALVIYLTGGLTESPVLIPGSSITLALALMAVAYMGAPALANVLTRLITREGWTDTQLRPQRRSWPYWLAAWFLPAVCTILGGVLFFVLFPRHFDPTLPLIRDALAAAGGTVPIPLWAIVALQTVSAVLMAPFLNSIFTFGEEFGWRGYLQPKLMPLGSRRATVLIGIIWGVWHWPVIAMGHNYGLEYPGAPWLGMLMMVWVTIGLAAFLGWVAVRSGCVWPAVIGHAAVNGISALAMLFVQGTPNPLLGPMPIGIIGSVGWVALALVLLLKPGALEPAETLPAPPSE